MRRTLCCAVLVAAVGASPQLVAQAPTGSSSPAAADLERLTVPAAALPANCHLRPTTGRGMLAGAFPHEPCGCHRRENSRVHAHIGLWHDAR